VALIAATALTVVALPRAADATSWPRLSAKALTWPNVASGQPDNVVADGQRIVVSGAGNALSFVLASTSGNTSGSGTVTYTDGSTQSYNLAVSDWKSGPTDTMTVELPHQNGLSGTSALSMKLYTDTVALNPAKTVASVTLLTFSGNQETTIPAGGQVVSDGVGFAIPADANLLVSIYLPGPVQLAPYHSLGTQDMYSTADQAGDQTTDVANYPVGTTFRYWTLLSGIDVVPAASVGTVVALGDSITDGFGSTVDGNNRWPDDLARRLLAQTQYPQAGVLDEGISSNQVLADRFTGVAGSETGGVAALVRLDRDVFAQTDVTTVIVLEGINDLKAGKSAASIIAGLQQIATEAHAHGLRIIVGTITPFEGASGYTAAYEANRETVNDFIRNNDGAFNGIVDFDAAVRDPSNSPALTAAYDSGDHLHLNSAGYQVMANAINLSTLS
jgi:lysophospholipase L1-like esterase